MHSLPLYSILQDLFTFYNIVVCVTLLSLLYCNPSCCPLATLAITILFLDPANCLDLYFIFSNKDVLRKALYWFLYQRLFLQFQLAFPVLRTIEQNNTPT